MLRANDLAKILEWTRFAVDVRQLRLNDLRYGFSKPSDIS